MGPLPSISEFLVDAGIVEDNADRFAQIFETKLALSGTPATSTHNDSYWRAVMDIPSSPRSLSSTTLPRSVFRITPRIAKNKKKVFKSGKNDALLKALRATHQNCNMF